MATTNSFSKTICSICYEDLKPIIEDLQSISICGHVFHELCLQQWFAYSSNAKKYSCPVCKQSCTANNVGRLYFQSIEDPNDAIDGNKNTQNVIEEDPSILRDEVKRLGAKVSRFNSILERQDKEIKELNEELRHCKEQLKKEAAMKSEALMQKASIQQLLRSKSEELNKSILECLGLQEKNLALAKELAALKLITDLNLEEDDALKLASLGHEANSKDTIDVLRRSLVIRNKSYKELMTKCNLLGRGEARYSRKLEKAKEKINKLKTRVQELESAIEAKDNKALRALKTSKKASCQGGIQNGTNDSSKSLPVSHSFAEEQMDLLSTPVNNLDRVGSMKNYPSDFRKTEDVKYIVDKDANFTKTSLTTETFEGQKNAIFLVHQVALKSPKAAHEHSHTDFNRQTKEYVIHKCILPRSEAVSDINEGIKHEADKVARPSDSKPGLSSDNGSLVATMDTNVVLLSDDAEEVQPKHNIEQKFSSSLPPTKPGDICFSGGLLGPDGTNRYLGKWCKRGQGKGSTSIHAPNTNNGDLIAVGADGRGGTIKVLRTPSQSSQDKENSASSKRCKYGAKTSSLQSKGCLQIEHFFGRVSHSSNV